MVVLSEKTSALHPRHAEGPRNFPVIGVDRSYCQTVKPARNGPGSGPRDTAVDLIPQRDKIDVLAQERLGPVFQGFSPGSRVAP